MIIGDYGSMTSSEEENNEIIEDTIEVSKRKREEEEAEANKKMKTEQAKPKIELPDPFPELV